VTSTVSCMFRTRFVFILVFILVMVVWLMVVRLFVFFMVGSLTPRG